MFNTKKKKKKKKKKKREKCGWAEMKRDGRTLILTKTPEGWVEKKKGVHNGVRESQPSRGKGGNIRIQKLEPE